MASSLDQRAVKFHTLGNNLAKEQKYNEAIQNFKKALEIEPEYAAAYFHMAEVYENKKLDDEAYDNYVKAIELNNSLATSHIESGLYTLMSGPLGKAVLDFKKKMDERKREETNDGDMPADEPQIAAPRAGSPVDLATRPAVEKPRGKEGIKPLKVLINAVKDDQDLEVGSIEKVIATVLGDKEIPVAKCPVSFIVRNDESMNDAAVSNSPAANAPSSAQSQIMTNGDGNASVYFKRSARVGTNRLEIRVKGLAPAVFEDTTCPAPIARVEVHPEQNYYSTAQEVLFQVKAFDQYDNMVPGREIALSLQMRNKAGNDWDIVDNQNPKTGDAGVLAQQLTMPTRGHAKSRLLIEDKKTGFLHEMHFTVVPGKATSILFIPRSGEINPGRTFPLKLRFMDEFDNAIDGISASISLKESSGGEWHISPPSSSKTEPDGSITVEVTPPAEEGATAVFEAISDHLPEGIVNTVNFETGALSDSGQADYSAHDEFGGEFDEIGDDSTDEISAIPTDLDIGMDGLAGLPDVEEAPQPDSDIMEQHVEGGLSALEGLDYGLDDAGEDTPPMDETSSMGSAGVEEPAGDSLSHLDAMLEGEEEPGQDFSSGDDQYYSPEDSGMETIDFSEEPPAAPEPYEESGGYEEPEYTPEPEAPAAPYATAQGLYSINVDTPSLTCRPGDTVPVKATITDESGNPVSAGLSVSLSIIEDIGPGGSSSFIDQYGGEAGREIIVEPDMSGEVAASVMVSTGCGSFTIEISTGDTTEQISINIAPGEPDAIFIQVSETEVQPGGQTEVIARIVDEHDNPVPGEYISLTLENYTGDPGVIDEHSDKMSDDNGEVIVLYTASQNPGDTATITAGNPSVATTSVTTATITVSGDSWAAAPPVEPEYEQAPPVDDAYQEDYYTEPDSGGTGMEYDAAAPPPPPLDMDAGAPPPPPSGDFSEAPPPPPGEFDAPPPPPTGDVDYDYSDDDDYDSYMEEAEEGDPYAQPVFDIKMGKKAAVEVSSIMPKLIMTGVAIVLLLGLLFLGLFGYKKVMYQYYYTQGVKKFTLSQNEQSMTFLLKAHEMAPNRMEPLQQLSQINIEFAERARKRNDLTNAENEINTAIGYLNKILVIDPGNIDAMFELGNAFEFKQDYCNALDQFDKIISLEPKFQAAEAKSKDLRPKCNRQNSMRKGIGKGRER